MSSEQAAKCPECRQWVLTDCMTEGLCPRCWDSLSDEEQHERSLFRVDMFGGDLDGS